MGTITIIRHFQPDDDAVLRALEFLLRVTAEGQDTVVPQSSAPVLERDEAVQSQQPAPIVALPSPENGEADRA